MVSVEVVDIIKFVVLPKTMLSIKQSNVTLDVTVVILLEVLVV